jgi:hypothetical protein
MVSSTPQCPTYDTFILYLAYLQFLTFLTIIDAATHIGFFLDYRSANGTGLVYGGFA